MEKDFEAMHCPNPEKVTLAAFMLLGGAFDWWDACRKKFPEGTTMTWELFKEEFNKKYFPSIVQRKMELQFLQLRQDHKSVAEYEIEFSRLGRYAQAYIQQDEMKAHHFEQGLCQPIKARVEVFKLKSFREVANKALTVEQAYIEERKESEQQCKKPKLEHRSQGINQKKIYGNANKNERPPFHWKC